jgi:hypothetical protein
MKFKMLYDNYKRMKPLTLNNQPTIPFYSYDQKSRTIEYDSDEEEDVNEVAALFKNTFSKFFNKDELTKKENEVVNELITLTIRLELYLPILTE